MSARLARVPRAELCGEPRNRAESSAKAAGLGAGASFRLACNVPRELWESNGPRMADWYAGSGWLSDPSPAMTLLVRNLGPRAVAVDLVFAVAILAMTAVTSEGSRRRELRRRGRRSRRVRVDSCSGVSRF